MSSGVLAIIQSTDAATRDLAVEQWCEGRDMAALLAACDELDACRRREANLYQRVRALLFIATIHRYHLPSRAELPQLGRVPYDGFRHLL